MRRIAQEKERVEREKAMREKVAAQTFARGYLNGLMGNVFDRLYDRVSSTIPCRGKWSRSLCRGSPTLLWTIAPTPP